MCDSQIESCTAWLKQKPIIHLLDVMGLAGDLTLFAFESSVVMPLKRSFECKKREMHWERKCQKMRGVVTQQEADVSTTCPQYAL